MWVELGLQTIHPKTMQEMNLCYTLEDFTNTLSKLKALNIKVVGHMILGFPNENYNMIMETASFLAHSNIWGIKLHLLNIVKGSPMAKTHSNYLPFKSIENYINLVCDIIEILPPEMIIHRLTADAPRKTLISPPWSYKKRTILNGINKELKDRNSFQGLKFKKQNTL